MINWLRALVLCCCVLGMTLAFANTDVLPNVQDDPNGTCGSLMQLADPNPPQAPQDQTTIDNIKACLANCDQLYQWYADQAQYDQMAAGISYCRANLTALYNQSIFLQANTALNQKNISEVSGTGSNDNLEQTQQPSILHRFLHPTPETAVKTSNDSGAASTDAQTEDNKDQSQPKQVNW